MGIAALVRPVPVPAQFLMFELWVMVGASALLLVFAFRGQQISRVAGAFLFASYAAYIWILFAGIGGMVMPAMA